MNTEDDNFDFQSEHSYSPPTSPAIGLTEVLEVLRRKWRLPVVGCLIGLTLAVGYFLSAPAPYKSSVRLLLDRSMNRYLATNKFVDQPTLDEADIGSQVYLLSSDSVIIPVVRSLDLTHDSEFVGPAKSGRLHSLSSAIKRFMGWSTTVNTPERLAVEAVIKHLTIYREDVANVINVTFESEDPNKAAKIANAIADTYLATTLDSRLRSTKIVSNWLEDRLKELRTQTLDADRALQDYKVAHNLVSYGKGALDSQQLLNLNTQLTNARIATVEAKARLDRIKKMGVEGILDFATTEALGNVNKAGGPINYALNNTDIMRLREQYRSLAAKAKELEAHVGPTHLVVLKLHERMDELHKSIEEEEKRIADSYASEYQIAAARENEVAANLTQLVGKTEATNQAQVTMRELESSADTLRNLYNGFLQKFKEINTLQTETIPVQNARIITRAVPTQQRSYKKSAVVLAGSLVLGLFFGAGIAVGGELAAGVFRTPKLVEQVTGIHCVVLPMISAKQEKTHWLGRKRALPLEEFVLDAPYSRFAEALRHVKTVVAAAPPLAQGAKVIGVVSSVAKEGKTTVAANLAALMTASSEARTLIIDADLHLRRLTTNLAPDAREGLIQALDDPTRLPSLVRKMERSGMDFLPSVLPIRLSNAADLLGSPKMEKLLLAARKNYDYIIVEIAPIMSVVDVKMIERFIDNFVFVVEWGKTKRRLVLEALSEAETIRGRVVSVVLNKADPAALRSLESYKGARFNDYYQE